MCIFTNTSSYIGVNRDSLEDHTVRGQNNVINNYIAIIDDEVASGSTEIVVASAQLARTLLNEAILVIQMQHEEEHLTGQYEFRFVIAVDGAIIQISQPLTHTYYSGGFDLSENDNGVRAAQVVHVPLYASFNVPAGASVTAKDWDGHTGGIVAVHANDMTIRGTISVNAKGFRGGPFAHIPCNTGGKAPVEGDSSFPMVA